MQTVRGKKCLLKRERKAKVPNLCSAAIVTEKHVAELHVAMDNPLRVDVDQAVRKLAGQETSLGLRDWALLFEQLS